MGVTGGIPFIIGLRFLSQLVAPAPHPLSQNLIIKVLITLIIFILRINYFNYYYMLKFPYSLHSIQNQSILLDKKGIESCTSLENRKGVI